VKTEDLFECILKCTALCSANEFASTGANEFANTDTVQMYAQVQFTRKKPPRSDNVAAFFTRGLKLKAH
jgi:hypothetical protein